MQLEICGNLRAFCGKEIMLTTALRTATLSDTPVQNSARFPSPRRQAPTRWPRPGTGLPAKKPGRPSPGLREPRAGVTREHPSLPRHLTPPHDRCRRGGDSRRTVKKGNQGPCGRDSFGRGDAGIRGDGFRTQARGGRRGTGGDDSTSASLSDVRPAERPLTMDSVSRPGPEERIGGGSPCFRPL